MSDLNIFFPLKIIFILFSSLQCPLKLPVPHLSVQIPATMAPGMDSRDFHLWGAQKTAWTETLTDMHVYNLDLSLQKLWTQAGKTKLC